MRSSAQIQKDINRALKESNGAWTGQLGALVTERMAAREAEKGGSVPRETTIMGQPHLLAYINEDERRLLKDLGGADIPGPGGIPSFPPTKEQKSQIEKQQAQKAAEREAQRDDRAPAGTYSGTGTKTVSTPAGTKTVSTSTSAPAKTVEVKSTAELRAEQTAKEAAARSDAERRTAEAIERLAQRDDRDDRAPAGTYVPAAPTPAQVTREPAPYTPLPPAIDYTTTASGRPYEETALRDIYVSGAEAALGPDAGVRYQDLRDTARSYGEDMGVTRAPIETAAPAIDPFADQMQSWFDEAASSPLSSGTTFADLAVSRIPSMTAGGIASLIGAVDPRSVGVTVSPTGQVDAFYRPTTPTAVEQYFRDVAARGREREGQIFSQMSPRLQQEVLAPILTRQAGYDVGQVDPRLAAAAGLDPDELIFNPRALGTQAILTLPSSIIPLGVSLLNPFAGYGLGAAMTVGEGERSVSDAFDAAYSSGEVQQSPLYQDMLRQTGGDEAAALAAVKNQVMNTATPMLTALGAGSTAIARNVSNIGGIITHALGVPASRTGATLAGASVEAATEGLEEGFLEKAAIAQPARGLTGLDIYPSIESMLGEGAVGALLGGGVGLGSGFVQSTPPFVQAVDPSTSQPAPPFIPAAPGPAPFTPGPGPAATMTVEGTATDVTPGFRPTGPTVGQIAQTPPGLASAYQQAADTMREAGVRNVGGAPAPGMMDVAAATEIINDLVATYGDVPSDVLQNIKDATGLSDNTIQDIVNNAPVVGTGRVEDIAPATPVEETVLKTEQKPSSKPFEKYGDILKPSPDGREWNLNKLMFTFEGTGGAKGHRYIRLRAMDGSKIFQSSAGSERDTNVVDIWDVVDPYSVDPRRGPKVGIEGVSENVPPDLVPVFRDWLEGKIDQETAISRIKDTDYGAATPLPEPEITPPLPEEGLPIPPSKVDTSGIASLPPTDPRLNIPPGSLPEAETTPAADPTTALVPSGSLPEAETTPAAEPTTALVPSGPATRVATTTTPGAGTQLDIAQPVDLTATPSETAAIIEFTPTEEFIEGTSVPITGQITGTVATNTTPATTQTTAATTTATSPGTFVFAEEPPEEEDGVMIDVEQEGPAPGGVDEEGVEVELPPETPETDEEEEAPFECPEGYTAVKMAGRWVCQKTETSMVGRPTIGTRPYLSQVGFAGPNPRPQQFTTRTRTITAAE